MPRFSAYVRLRPFGVSEPDVQTDSDDPAVRELVRLAALPLDVDIDQHEQLVPDDFAASVMRATTTGPGHHF